jgi:hypothetical protein
VSRVVAGIDVSQLCVQRVGDFGVAEHAWPFTEGEDLLTGEYVEDDIFGVDTVGDRLDAGDFDCIQSVGKDRGEEFKHLAIAVMGASELAQHTVHPSVPLAPSP